MTNVFSAYQEMNFPDLQAAAHEIESNSISKINVAFGGIVPG